MLRILIRLLLSVLLINLVGCGVNQEAQRKPDPPSSVYDSQAQQDLQWTLQRELEQFDGKTGIYAKNLKTGQVFSFQQDTIFPTASTHKIVVALAVYKYLYPYATTEEKKSYDQNIYKMMVVSDNTAYELLLSDIEKKQSNALTCVLADLNLTHTRIHSREAFSQYGYHSITTPYEMGVVFETIYNEMYLGQELSGVIKEELGKTIYQQEMPRYMQNVKVVHKVGELPGVKCDVGVVDDGRDLILISAYTTSPQESAYSSNFLADISAKTYNLLRTY